jgi:PKD repeat protein
MLLCAAVASAQTAAPKFTTDQTLSDEAQRTTLAFSGLAMMTGNLEAQSFFPPGKVADYTGFQYLRDNDPDNMGHNTSFLTRVANNVIYILNDSQFAQLKTLATAQLTQIDLYGYKRFPLMKAFRRLLDGDLPAGSTGLSLDAVKQASRELYVLDGQISFDRALLYANVIDSLDPTQKAYLDAMKGRGWNSWPDITNDQIRSRMAGLPQGTAVAVMTYASDLFSWYAGSVEADVYFCPERHGTYYGSFYIKDAPAIGHEGYSIDEQLTATAGAALCDSSKGYVTQDQAALISSLVDRQRANLYASPTANIVKCRTDIATLLRSLLTSTAASDVVKAQVLELSEVYGDLDGENNYAYATVFADVYKTLTTDQKTKLAGLRESIMSGSYADGTPFDYSVCTTPFLYSSVITDLSLLSPYLANTDYLFAAATAPVAAFTFTPSSPVRGQAVVFTDISTGSPTSWSWTFGDGVTSALQNPSHVYSAAGTLTVTLTASNAFGSNSVSKTLTVSATGTAPTAAFSFSPASPVSGQSVQFTDASTGNPTAWRWTFGDGATSAAQHPTHAFAAAGVFTVTLTATNAVGSSAASMVVGVTTGAGVVQSVWVPVVTHADGANNSHWRTDTGILNVNETQVSYEVRLYRVGSTPLSMTGLVAAGSQSILQDIAGQMGFAGSGAIEVRSNQALKVSSRTYSQIDGAGMGLTSGTVGQGYLGIPAGQGLAAGQSAWLPQLTHNAAYRCNIGLTNTGSGPAVVTVGLYRGDGTLLTSYTVDLQPGDWKQEDGPFERRAGQTAMDRGYAKVTVVSGSGVVAIASVIDNLTNDPTMMPMAQGVPDGGGSSGFAITSPAFADGGAIPVEYTCDGAGSSPPLAWSGAPDGTVALAIMMTTLALDGQKWNWVLYAIPASVTSLAENTAGVGTAGVTSDGPEPRYYPPCSKGPGAKTYTFTIYALSGNPTFAVPAGQVTGEILTAAIGQLTLATAEMSVTYTR